MLLQPTVEIEVVVLLAPQHSGQRLAVHATFVLAQRARGDPVIKLVRVSEARGKDLVKRVECVGCWLCTQSQPYDLAATRRHLQAIVGGRFRARLVWIHSLLLA